jgi:hypothetical protein
LSKVQPSLTRREIVDYVSRALKDTAKFIKSLRDCFHKVDALVYMLLGHGHLNEDSPDYIKVRVRRKEDFHFVNVDLELESTESVQPLVKELEKVTFALYCSDIDEMANLELHIEKRNGVYFYDSYDDEKDLVGGVDIHISEFCNLIENLSPESKKIWDKCHRKEFDIGFQAGNTPKAYHTRIRTETLERCARLGATIEITVYPYLNYEMRRKNEVKKKSRIKNKSKK